MTLFNSCETLKNEATEATEATKRPNPLYLLNSGSHKFTDFGEDEEPQKATESIIFIRFVKDLKAPIDYQNLAESGKTDLEVDDLNEAIFLFALDLVRTCPDENFMEMGHRYCPHWRKRMPPEAWVIVKEEIKHRLKQMEGKRCQ